MPRLTLQKVAVEDSGAYQFEDVQPAIHHGYNLPMISKLIPDGIHKILDAGCGNGYTTNWLTDRGQNVWGCDYSQSGVDMAHKNFPDLTFFQAEDGIRDAQESRGLGDVYKRQGCMDSGDDM